MRDEKAEGMVLTRTRIRAGMWEGVLTGAPAAPQLDVSLDGADVPGLIVSARPDRTGEWAVRVPIPPATISEGVQTFLIRDRATGATLGHFTVIAGAEAEDDLRAEVDLLRAELDLLKRAFRRHCVESGH